MNNPAYPPTALATRGITCNLCGERGHKLADCMGSSSDGWLHGCPECDTKAHDAFDCDKFKALAENQNWDYLVTK